MNHEAPIPAQIGGNGGEAASGGPGLVVGAGRAIAGPALPDAPINILIVDDEPKNLTVLETVLDDPSYRLVRAASADEALLALVVDEFALLILDIRMPGMTGFELAQMIKERKKTSHVPIIFLTAYYNEDQHVLDGYSAGAVDYLHKPVNPVVLRSKVAGFAELYRKNRELGMANVSLLAEVAERRRVEKQMQDLTETLEQRVKERTEALRENRSRLRQAADAARLTYVVDFISASARPAENFAAVMGFTVPLQGDDASAAIRLLLEHVVPHDRPRVEAALQDLMGGKPVNRIEYRVLGDDQIERWIESTWSVELSSEDQSLKTFATNLDITARKHAEEDLRRANQDLEQFAFSASHDLQEPLRNVAIFGQLLQKRYGNKLDAEAEEFVGYIIEGAQRVSLLVTDLLAYTQAASLEREPVTPVDAGNVFEKVLKGLQNAVRESHGAVTSGPLPFVAVKEIHLQQLLQNLIGNALKYRQDDEPPLVHVSAVRQDFHWRFCIQDNGIGIAPEHQAQVFGIFKRLHAKGGKYAGTGIGLAICEKIVGRYGGRIWMESELGKGTKVYFTVPAAGDLVSE